MSDKHNDLPIYGHEVFRPLLRDLKEARRDPFDLIEEELVEPYSYPFNLALSEKMTLGERHTEDRRLSKLYAEERYDDMRLYTKIQALKDSIELWEWLADNPGESKTNFYGSFNIAEMKSYCPICEENETSMCNGCLMVNRWPLAEGDELVDECCRESEGEVESAFVQWDEYGRKSEPAMLLVEAFKKRLKELEGDNESKSISN